nr:hypothetical protein [Tanacetum cinerariifolium]
MENANPFGPPVPPNVPRDHIVQELDELLEISAMIDSHLRNIDHNQIMIPPPAPPEQLLNDLFDVESVDTPFVCPFVDSDDQKMHYDASFATRKEFYNPLDIVPKRCSVVRQDSGFLSFFKGIVMNSKRNILLIFRNYLPEEYAYIFFNLPYLVLYSWTLCNRQGVLLFLQVFTTALQKKSSKDSCKEANSRKRTHDDQDPPENHEGEKSHKKQKFAGESSSGTNQVMFESSEYVGQPSSTGKTCKNQDWFDRPHAKYTDY